MAQKSVLNESRQIDLAIQLIELGARLQVLESEIDLSYDRLSRLYNEILGKSPPKGQLPFSTDWYLTWQPNIHSSLFMNIYLEVDAKHQGEKIESLIKAYRLYQEQVQLLDVEAVLSFTRAWRLVKFFNAKMLINVECKACGGHFVADAYANPRYYVCGLCKPPSRAGRGQSRGSLKVDDTGQGA
jgi:flagellar transcriptional activator FlhC